MTTTIYAEIIQAGQRIEARYRDALHAAQMRITPRQVMVLEFYAAHHGSTQTEAVTGTGIDRSTLADLVRRLVDRNLLQRKRRRDDARAYNVMVTGHGETVLKAARDVLAGIQVGDFSDRGMRDLRAMLAKIAPPLDDAGNNQKAA